MARRRRRRDPGRPSLVGPTGRLSGGPWERRRQQVFDRDAGRPCPGCGRVLDRSEPYRLPDGRKNPWSLEVDHIWPMHLGGDERLSNLRAMHSKCNKEKSDSEPVAGPRPVRESPTVVVRKGQDRRKLLHDIRVRQARESGDWSVLEAIEERRKLDRARGLM